MDAQDWKRLISKRDVTAKSWLHLVELLHAESFDKKINRYRSRYAFRGLENSEFDLKTSLIRLGHDSQTTTHLEPVILRSFRKYAHRSILSNPTARLEGWLAEHIQCVKRIIIPHDLKWEVRDKLDQMNLTERVIYPGLDGLSKWLRRYYSPRK